VSRNQSRDLPSLSHRDFVSDCGLLCHGWPGTRAAQGDHQDRRKEKTHTLSLTRARAFSQTHARSFRGRRHAPGRMTA